MSRQSADVVVIGAGVVGSLLAFRLSQRGHRVVVVERREPCRGTTAATFSWTSAHGKKPLFYHLFNLASIELYRSLADELGVDVWWRPIFSLRPVLDETSYENRFGEVQTKKKEGYRLSWLDGNEARKRVPMLNPDALGASLCEGEGIVNPFRLVFAALHAARNLGAELNWGEQVIGFEISSDRIDAVLTNRRTISSHVVINAAGPQAPEIAHLAGVPLPFQHSKGEVLLTEKFPPHLNAVIGGIQQTFAGNFLIGATQDLNCLETNSTIHNIGKIARSACRMIPALRDVKIIRSYAGIRPMPVDGLSILGPSKKCEGFYWAATHSGITLAPVMAAVIAEFIEGRQHPSWDDRFSPNRFESVPV